MPVPVLFILMFLLGFGCVFGFFITLSDREAKTNILLASMFILLYSALAYWPYVSYNALEREDRGFHTIHTVEHVNGTSEQFIYIEDADINVTHMFHKMFDVERYHVKAYYEPSYAYGLEWTGSNWSYSVREIEEE